jgi:hypothetical protein
MNAARESLFDDRSRKSEVPGKWAKESPPTGRCVGVVDEYGTVWDGEPGASRIIGDLIVREDEETSWLYLTEGEPLSKLDRMFALLRGEIRV